MHYQARHEVCCLLWISRKNHYPPADAREYCIYNTTVTLQDHNVMQTTTQPVMTFSAVRYDSLTCLNLIRWKIWKLAHWIVDFSGNQNCQRSSFDNLLKICNQYLKLTLPQNEQLFRKCCPGLTSVNYSSDFCSKKALILWTVIHVE